MEMQNETYRGQFRHEGETEYRQDTHAVDHVWNVWSRAHVTHTKLNSGSE